MVRGIIALAHGLGLSTIAEGIETPEELKCLAALGCDYGQGFLLARPLDREKTERVLAAWSPSDVASLTGSLTAA